jgi:hypothetical protein
MASTGYESDIATARPEKRLNAPGPAVAKQTPSRLVYMAYPQAMKDAACSWRTMMGRIRFECLSASMRPAAFSPAPPKAASTPTPSKPLTMASYTRIAAPLSPLQMGWRYG